MEHEGTGDQTGPLEEIRPYLETFLNAARIEVEIQLSVERDALVVDLSGDDSQLLLERGGETLDALQTLIGKILPRRFGTTMRVLVDSNGYRSGREREIIEIARRTAETVVKSGQAYELSPMNAHERRVVHLALQDFGGVMTESTGEGPRRRVMILPDTGQD